MTEDVPPAESPPPASADADPDPLEVRPLPPHLSFTAGFLMGAADSVPGVSGGTIALILGVYERFVTALSRILGVLPLRRTPEGRARFARAFRLLLPLGIGLVLAYWFGTRLLVGPADHPGWLRRADAAPLCYAFFFGLVLVSLREPWRRVRARGARHWIAAALAAAAAAAFIGLPHATGQPPTWALIYGGALAVTVMLLPGVSGSLLLVVLGQYTTVAGALHDGKILTLLVFVGGVGLGLVAFVPLLKHLLRRHHDLTMAALTGLMAGSLRALWPWKANYDPAAGPLTNAAPEGDWPWVLLMLVLGALAAWGLVLLERRMNPPTTPPVRG